MGPDTAVKVPSISWACIKLNRATFLEKFSLKGSYYTLLSIESAFMPSFLRRWFASWMFSLYEFARMLIYLLLWLVCFLILFLFHLLTSESPHASALKTHLFLIHGCHESMPWSLDFLYDCLCIDETSQSDNWQLRELLPNLLELIVQVGTEKQC